MLEPGRYLLGVLYILTLGLFAWMGGTELRRRLLPRFEGAPARLATAVLALALLIWAAELLGSFGILESTPYQLLFLAVGWKLARAMPRPPERGEPHPHLQVRVRLPSLRRDGRQWQEWAPTLIALLVAGGAGVDFAGGGEKRPPNRGDGVGRTRGPAPVAAG